MKNKDVLDTMYIESFLRLQLLRKGYQVHIQPALTNQRYDLVVTHKDRTSKPSFAIDLKKYSPAVKQARSKPLKGQLASDGYMVVHTVYVKHGGQEIVTDEALARLLASDSNSGMKVVSI